VLVDGAEGGVDLALSACRALASVRTRWKRRLSASQEREKGDLKLGADAAHAVHRARLLTSDQLLAHDVVCLSLTFFAPAAQDLRQKVGWRGA